MDSETIDGIKGHGRLQSAICIILLLLQTTVFYAEFCCNERVMVSKRMFKVRSELTHVQGSYKASKYCNKYFNVHPHVTLGPADACKKLNEHGVHEL